MNDIYIFYIYILIIHYIIQLYNIRMWLASRAELSLVPQLVKWPSRAELGQPPSCTEPSRAELGSARFQARLVSSPTPVYSTVYMTREKNNTENTVPPFFSISSFFFFYVSHVHQPVSVNSMYSSQHLFTDELAFINLGLFEKLEKSRETYTDRNVN
jgi:hypothetical protein